MKPVTLVRNLITSLTPQAGVNVGGQQFTMLPSSQSSQAANILSQSVANSAAGSQGLTLLSQQGLQYVSAAATAAQPGLQYVSAAGAVSQNTEAQQSQTQFLVC